MGLMQLMPKTYFELRARYHLGPGPVVPATKSLLAAPTFRNGTTGMACRFPRCLQRQIDPLRRPLPIETQSYVALLMLMIDGGRPDE